MFRSLPTQKPHGTENFLVALKSPFNTCILSTGNRDCRFSGLHNVSTTYKFTLSTGSV